MNALTKNALHGLYVISDETLIHQTCFAETIEKTLRGGARIIQYRDKSSDKTKRLHQATALKKLCRAYQAKLIINDDLELALKIDADGVHIGSHDTTLAEARSILGTKIIGVSCYNQFDLAIAAEKNTADYIAFGSFFTSSTKPDAVRADTSLIIRAKQELNIPICVIGGITADNARPLIQTGADMVAVISDILSSNNIESRCTQFVTLLNQHKQH